MTTEELVKHYSSLMVLQYKQKPKASATIEALVEPAIMDQLPVEVNNSFDVDSAVGVQLDILGKYVGVVRSGYSSGKFILLEDDEFRQFIKLAIIKNQSHSDLKTIQDLIYKFFPGNIIVFDYLGMRIGYYFDISIGSQDLVRLFVAEDLIPKPMGVSLASTVYAFDIFSFFGCSSYIIPARNVSPFNDYQAYAYGTPWLSYRDDIRNDLNYPPSLVTESGDVLVQENGSLLYI